MAKRILYPLYAAEDEPRVRPILDALKETGFSIGKTDAPEKGGAVLFFLSDKLNGASDAIDAFLRFDAEKRDIIPVNLDGSTPPALIGNAIMARNTVFAERYTEEELAGRIADALKKPAAIASKLRKWIIAAAAVVLLAVLGIVLWRVLGSKPAQETDAEATPAPVIPGEIPPEDLDKIVEIVYVGDAFVYFTDDDGYYAESDDGRNYGAIAYTTWEDDGTHFYSKEDGHEYPFSELSDLSYLSCLPNLQHLTLANVRCELPDLSGLSALKGVIFICSEIPDLNGLSGSVVRTFEYHGHTVTDFSSLSGCAELSDVDLDLHLTEAADFSGFHPPKLTLLSIANADRLPSVDLSALDQCPSLTRLELERVPIGDLKFLSDCTSPETLILRYIDLRTLDGVENLKNLRILALQDVSYLADISAVEGCTALEIFSMSGYPEHVTVSDLSALGKLPHLYYVSNVAALNTDLNFLKEMETKQNIIFSFVDFGVTDYSGFGAIESYNYIYMNMNTKDPAPALQFLQDVPVDALYLRCAVNTDLSLVSHMQTELALETCDIRDFSTLGDDSAFRYLSIDDCGYLQSLSGIEKIKGFGTEADGEAKGGLYVEDSPHLVDWSALNGMYLEEIGLIGLSTLPDFSTFSAQTYYLGGFPDMTDLTCFENLDPAHTYNFILEGLDGLTDISTLYRLKGGHLCIRPEWKEQAEELVRTGVFESYEIKYPDTQWQPNDAPITLLSLDELETLPQSVLNRVETLCMAGDFLFDGSEYHIEEEWNDDSATLFLCKNDSDERIPIEPGTKLSDLSVLKKLTGLRELHLCMQPLQTLDGIQYLESLETLTVEHCESLTDVSAAFTLQKLVSIELRRNENVVSIEGIQNLYRLERADLDCAGITDLSPLLSLHSLQYAHVSEAMEAAARSLGDAVGFELRIGDE